MATTIIYPTSTEACSGMLTFSAGTSGTAWQLVDDTKGSYDDTTTLITYPKGYGGVGRIQFAATNLAAGTTALSSLVIEVRAALASGFGGTQLSYGITLSGTNYTKTIYSSALGINFVTDTYTLTGNPATSTAWDEASINNVSLWLDAYGGSTVRITGINGTVEYAELSTPAQSYIPYRQPNPILIHNDLHLYIRG